MKKLASLIAPICLAALLLVSCDSKSQNGTIKRNIDQSKFYEIILLWTKKDPKLRKQLQQYEKDIYPIASKMGGKRIAAFKPLTKSADFNPDKMVIVEWPNFGKMREFLGKKRVKKLFKVRNEALDKIEVTIIKPSASKTISFKEDQVIEISSFWIKDQKLLGKFFKSVIPVALENGAAPLIQFAPTKTLVGNFVPSVISLTAWPSMKSFEKFSSNKNVKSSFPILNKALSRFHITHTKFIR